MRGTPPLTALRAFEAVGRLGNIKDAADTLSVTPAAVSHQIRSLEDHLGIMLFYRSRGGLELTSSGDGLLPFISKAFEMILQGTNAVSMHAATTLRVNSLPTFASSWLVPRLRDFREIHPEIDLEVNTEGRLGSPLDYNSLQADIAIRAAMPDHCWGDLEAEALTHETMFPVCSPALLKGPIPLRRPADLARHTLLIASRSPEGWREWLDAAAKTSCSELSKLDANRGPKFDTIQMAMNAAVEGMGVVMGRTPLVNAYLASGQLLAPFEMQVTSRRAYWLVGRREDWNTPPVQAFRSWIRQLLPLKPGVELVK